MTAFAETGFPTTSQEEWRFTNVAPIARTTFAPPRRAPLDAAFLGPLQIPGGNVARVVLVDGRFDAGLSDLGPLENGVRVVSLARALADDAERVRAHLGRLAAIEGHPFTALNTAFLEDGVFLTVADGTLAENPIEILYVATASAEASVRHPRTLVVAGARSQLALVESFVTIGEGPSLTNAVTEIILGPNAIVDHYKLQRESLASYHISRTEGLIAESAVLRSHSFTLGAGLSRNDACVVLNGEGADSILNGLYVVDGTQHVDHHTAIDHAKPHCTSHELFKGILAGRATGVFNGRILVRQDAQKTDSKQTNKNLLLSEDALVQTNPQLEIYADDVKCTHGATIGQIDENALFYLRSRGIARETANAVLTYAFAAEVVEKVRPEGLRRLLEQRVAERFGGALGEGWPA
jgi:Fe-S cluster assembly protein SufD